MKLVIGDSIDSDPIEVWMKGEKQRKRGEKKKGRVGIRRGI
jgi:hypothetical protein